MPIAHPLVFAAVVACLVAGPGAAAPQLEGSFYAFWPQFRAAALAGDDRALAALAADTIRLPGATDDAAAGSAPRARAGAIVRTALAQDSGIDPDHRVTNREFVAATQRIDRPFAPLIAIGGDGAQVGAFEFRHVAGRWLLTAVFVRTDEKE